MLRAGSLLKERMNIQEVKPACPQLLSVFPSLSVLETDVKGVTVGGGTTLAWWAPWHSKYGELFLFLIPSEAFPKCSEGVWVFYFDRHEKKQTQLYLLQSVARYSLSKIITLLSQMAGVIWSLAIKSHRGVNVTWFPVLCPKVIFWVSFICECSWMWKSAPRFFGLLMVGSPAGGPGAQ